MHRVLYMMSYLLAIKLFALLHKGPKSGVGPLNTVREPEQSIVILKDMLYVCTCNCIIVCVCIFPSDN